MSDRDVPDAEMTRRAVAKGIRQLVRQPIPGFDPSRVDELTEDQAWALLRALVREWPDLDDRLRGIVTEHQRRAIFSGRSVESAASHPDTET